MTREDFELGYAERSGMTVEAGYDLGIFPALPCDCGELYCEGWRRRYRDEDDEVIRW